MSRGVVSASQQSVKASIESAISQKMVRVETADAMLEQLDDIAVAGACGVDVDEIDSEEATLVAVVIDASYSMEPFQKAVIAAYNKRFLAPMRKAKNANSIYVTVWIFSAEGHVDDYCRLVHGYKPVSEADELTTKVYNPSGGTPLNMAVHRAMTGIVSYGQTLRDAGTTTKCIMLVLSDGEENSSGRNFTATKVRKIAEDLLKQEIYILSYCFFGMSSDDAVNDREAAKYAKQIGFPDRHRMTVMLNDSGLRRLFGTVSASVISASQTQVSSTGLSSNAFFAANPQQPRGAVMDDDD